MEDRSVTSPKQFADAFIQLTTEKHTELADLWDQSALYTGLMRGVVLPRVAERLGLLSWPNEYYTLDSIFFREKDTMHFGEHSTYAKHIEVAIEHENAIKGSEKEMNKLQLFNAPLKVLITYDNRESDQPEYLKKYQAIINGADVFNDISTHRKQLLILGRKPTDKIQWSAFVYEGTGFVPLRAS
jgi:hypothetical protein